MSVEAVQNRLICEELTGVAERPEGTEGACVSGAACNVIELVLDTPARVAVTTAVWLDVTALAVAVKVAVVAPAATVTEGGTARAELLSDTLTSVPPLGAACDKVTVQVTFPGGVSELGVHVRLVSVGDACHPWTVMVPPLPETATALPSARDPIVPLTEMRTDPLLVAEASVAVTTATTPLPITVEFIPVAKQTIDPVPVLH